MLTADQSQHEDNITNCFSFVCKLSLNFGVGKVIILVGIHYEAVPARKDATYFFESN